MANDQFDPFDNQLNQLPTIFKNDLLDEIPQSRWPDQIDYVAAQVAQGSYPIGLGTQNPRELTTGGDLDDAAFNHYLRGLAKLTDRTSLANSIPDSFRLGDLLVQFSELRQGLENVGRADVPPGEVLSRLITRSVQRQTDGETAQLAQELRPETQTPRELIAQLAAVPEIADQVERSLPNRTDPTSLVERLAAVELTTELWEHQLEALALWLHHGMNAYVDMATATGKTVLGLAAMAYAVDSGSLHPADQDRLRDIFDGDIPSPPQHRSNDLLIVTTDDLLGVQWARLFQEHCHTPPEYTQIEDGSISLPWGEIDIRSAKALSGVDPSDYRLAIFDEVHNYSASAGWGSELIRFVDSACPVIALTGSVTEEFERLISQTEASFPVVYRYTHDLALQDGVIPDFEWTLAFTKVQSENGPLDDFRRTARLAREVITFDPPQLQMEAETLRNQYPELSSDQIQTLTGQYETGAEIAKTLRSVGEQENTAPIEALESLAAGLSNRSIHRLNLQANLDIVIELTEQAVTDERPVLILTRSYAEAKTLWQELYERNSDREIVRLDQDASPGEQDATIQRFDELETGKKVLIGPGKRIGQGNDIRTVEVGINLSRPGSGVNATLVQRLGRLLRDAGGKGSVDFYHVLGVPPSDGTIPPDGESFVRNVAGFFAQVLAPDTDGILKTPHVRTGDEVVASAIVDLEQSGAEGVLVAENTTETERAYANAIQENYAATDDPSPVVDSDWFEAAFPAQVGDTSLDQQTTDSSPAEQSTYSETTAATSSEGSLQVLVETEGGDPLADVFISVVDEDKQQAIRTNENGMAEFEPSADEIVIGVHHPEAGIDSATLTVRGGDSIRETITLPGD